MNTSVGSQSESESESESEAKSEPEAEASGDEAASAGARAENPYVGPVPFDDSHTLYGRERETLEVLQLLISKRVTLLISPSGAGKTSLIQAGLIRKLNELRLGRPDAPHEGLTTLPVARVDVPNERCPNTYVASVLQSLETRYAESERLSPERLATETLQSYFALRHGSDEKTPHRQRCLLILDQFEEMFTLNYADWDKKKEFFVQLGALLSAAGDGPSVEEPRAGDLAAPVVWLLISMREDFVAELEPYCHLIPTGLTFRYRLLPLERGPAIQAVIGPAGSMFDPEAAERLVDDLRIVHQTGASGVPAPDKPLGRYLEPMLLQVSCRRLWERIVVLQKRRIVPTDVASESHQSEVDNALGEYFGMAVADSCKATKVKERRLRDWIEQKLITSSKMRSRVLFDRTGLANIVEALDVLLTHHIVRTEFAGDRSWIELSHDRLVLPVLKNNQEWRSSHLSNLQKQADLWYSSGKKPDFLFTGEELDGAVKFANGFPEDLSSIDKQFLEASKQERARLEKERKLSKRMTFLAILAGVLFVVAGAGCVFAIVQSFKANHERESAQSKSEELERNQQALETANRKIRSQLDELQRARTNDELLKLITAVSNAHETADPGIFKNVLDAADASNKPDFAKVKPAVDAALMEVLGPQPPVQALIGTHKENVASLAFTPDGKFLYSGALDGLIKSWTLPGDGKPVQVYSESETSVYVIAIHPARGLLAAASKDGAVRLFRFNAGELQPLAVLAEASAPTGPKRSVMSLGFNADGTRLVAAGWDKKATVWKLPDPVSAPFAHTEYGPGFHDSVVGQAVFLDVPGQPERLVTADWHGRLGIWRVDDSAASKRPERELALREMAGDDIAPELRGAIISMALSHDGRWLFVGDNDGFVSGWDLDDKKQQVGVHLGQKELHDGGVTSLTLSDDGKVLVSTGDDLLLTWSLNPQAKSLNELRSELKVRGLYGWGEKLYSVAFEPGSSQLAAVGGTSRIRLVDLSGSAELSTRLDIPASSPTPMIASSVASDDTKLIASVSDDGKSLLLWQRQGGRLVEAKPAMALAERAQHVALSPDGRQAAVLYCSGAVSILDLDSNKTTQPMAATISGEVRQRCRASSAMSFDPSGKKLFVGVNRRALLLVHGNQDWDAYPLKDETRTIEGRSIEAVAFSPDGSMIAVAGSSDHARVWFLDGHTPPADSDTRIESRVTAMTFSPDSKTLVIAGQDGRITEWRMPAFEYNAVNSFHRREVTGLSYRTRQNSPFLLSSDRDGQLLICQSGIAVQNCGIMARVGSSVQTLMAGPGLDDVVVVGANDLYWFNLNHDYMLRKAREHAGQ